MASKNKLPAKAPHFPAGEWMAGLATGTLCLISALALAYHVWDEIKVSHGAVKLAFTILAGLFAFLMGLTPMTLSKAHGSALEGSNAQTGLLIIVGLFMVVDGALLIHAVQYLQKLMGMTPAPLKLLIPLAIAFETAAFFVRSQLYAVSNGIQELIDARAHEREMARENRRSKLEAEATALGIIFDGRTSDSILQGKIHQRRMHAV